MSVWVYMIVAVVTEVETALHFSPPAAVDVIVAVLAASQAVAVVIFYMDLKNEPGALRLFALLPLMFVAALLLGMVATLG